MTNSVVKFWEEQQQLFPDLVGSHQRLRSLKNVDGPVDASLHHDVSSHCTGCEYR